MKLYDDALLAKGPWASHVERRGQVLVGKVLESPRVLFVLATNVTQLIDDYNRLQEKLERALMALNAAHDDLMEEKDGVYELEGQNEGLQANIKRLKNEVRDLHVVLEGFSGLSEERDRLEEEVEQLHNTIAILRAEVENNGEDDSDGTI
jgi:chromosome segregation ATPase